MNNYTETLKMCAERIANCEHHIKKHPEHKAVKKAEADAYRETRDMILEKIND